jgi:type VI secretion system protein ImpG
MLPFSKRSFPGYLLLFEYFCFPEKFLFFDITGLDDLKTRKLTDTLDIWIYLNRPAKPDLFIDKDTFCPNTAPIVNLFKRVAEPISVEHQKIEYPVIPDIRRPVATEVFSIDRVSSTSADSHEKEREFRPFYSISHYLEDELDTHKAFWHMHRKPSDKKDDKGTNIFLSFTDLHLKPTSPNVKTCVLHITCTNRDLPSRLPFGDPEGDFQLETAAPVERIQCLIKPTQTVRPSLGGTLQWRLISHLSLNYLSIVEGGEEALKETLKLYDFDNSPANRQQINGIVSLQSKHITKRIGQSICRGIQTTIDFDEDKFVGTGLYLFASVLERFLAEYVSLNSFSQLIAKTIQKKEILKQWPPRNGNQVLL